MQFEDTYENTKSNQCELISLQCDSKLGGPSYFIQILSWLLRFLFTRWPFDNENKVKYNKIYLFMIAFLTAQKMTKRQPAEKATGVFIAVANMHLYGPLV